MIVAFRSDYYSGLTRKGNDLCNLVDNAEAVSWDEFKENVTDLDHQDVMHYLRLPYTEDLSKVDGVTFHKGKIGRSIYFFVNHKRRQFIVYR